MKIKVIGFSVTEYGTTPYPEKFKELVLKYFPAANVELVAVGGLSIDGLPCLIRDVFILGGCDLLVLEIATSWWSKTYPNDEQTTAHHISRLLDALDAYGTPYCFLHLYRRDLLDNDIVVREIKNQVGTSIPVIDLKAIHRARYEETGDDGTVDGIHPGEPAIEEIARELFNHLFTLVEGQAQPMPWASWQRASPSHREKEASRFCSGEAQSASIPYFFRRSGVGLSGYVIEQGRSARISFPQAVKITGVFFEYGPDTNFLKIEYADVSIDIQMHDRMSFYRRLGYLGVPSRVISEILISHPTEDRSVPLDRESWVTYAARRCVVFGFSSEESDESGKDARLVRTGNVKVFFYGASVTQQGKGSGYVGKLIDALVDDDISIACLGIGGCHFNDAGYFNVERVLESEPDLCILEWSTTGQDWIDDRKINTVLSGLARAGCVPAVLILPSKSNLENDRRAEKQLTGLCERLGIPFLDLRRRVPMVGVFRDDVHTTDRGASVYAGEIAPWVSDLARRYREDGFRFLFKRLQELSYSSLPKILAWDGEIRYSEDLCFKLRPTKPGPLSVAITTTVGLHSPIVEVQLNIEEKKHTSVVSIWDRWSYYDRDLIRVLLDSHSAAEANEIEIIIRLHKDDPDYGSCVKPGIEFPSERWFNIKALHLEGAEISAAYVPKKQVGLYGGECMATLDSDSGHESDPNHIVHSFYHINGLSSGYIEKENITLVSSSGIPFDQAGTILERAIDEHIFWLPSTMPPYGYTEDRKKFSENMVKERKAFLGYHAKEIWEIAKKNELIVQLPKDFVYVDLTHPFGWYAYGHLHDTLQRLYNVQELLPRYGEEKVRFVVSDHARVKGFAEHLSALSGHKITDENICVTRRGHVYVTEKYIKPALSSVYTGFTSRVYEWVRRKYDQHFLKKNKRSSRLYLTRNHVTPGKRGVLNEEDMLPLLESFEFTMVTGDESLSEIYELFNNAELVIGAHGSLFANTIYCEEGCVIIEYCARARVDLSFMRKTKRAAKYIHKIVDCDEHFNILIPPDDIRHAAVGALDLVDKS